MSFFDAIKRLATGQPVFSAESENESKPEAADQDTPKPAASEPSQQQSGTPRDEQGEKILPVVTVKRVECRLDGDRMQCWGVLQNQSLYKMELDKITLLGSRLELDNYLQPNEEREYLLYSGDRPTDENNHDCDLVYINESGDYFNAEHYVHFTLQSDGTYIINRLEFSPPVRDI